MFSNSFLDNSLNCYLQKITQYDYIKFGWAGSGTGTGTGRASWLTLADWGTDSHHSV